MKKTNFLILVFSVFFVFSCSGKKVDSPEPPDPSLVIGLESIELSSLDETIFKGESITLTATGHYEDGSTKDVTSSITWTSSDTLVANVVGGVVTGLGGGISTIEAKLDSIISIATVRVKMHIAYVSNVQSNNISVYQLNHNTGQASLVSSSTYQGYYLKRGSVVHPNGKYFYSVAKDSNTLNSYIVIFEINQNTGGLSASSISPVTLVNEGYSLELHPSGKFLYVSIPASNLISVFKVGDNGALSLVENKSVGNLPILITMHPNGEILYVPNFNGSNITAYKINQVTGTLSNWGSPGAPIFQPVKMVVSPTGKYLYVLNYLNSKIFIFNLLPDFKIGTFVDDIATVTNPADLIISSEEKKLYVIGSGDDKIGTHQILANDMIPTAGMTTVDTGPQPVAMRLDPTSKFLYAVNSNGNILTMYGIDANENLQLLNPPSTSTGDQPSDIAVTSIPLGF